MKATVLLVEKYNRQKSTILGSKKDDLNNLIRIMDPSIPTI